MTRIDAVFVSCTTYQNVRPGRSSDARWRVSAWANVGAHLDWISSASAAQGAPPRKREAIEFRIQLGSAPPFESEVLDDEDGARRHDEAEQRRQGRVGGWPTAALDRPLRLFDHRDDGRVLDRIDPGLLVRRR